MAGSHILILGGTGEARRLAARLGAVTKVTLSLAGRTTAPLAAPVPTRIGGFGGSDGLARWITENAVTDLVDATHPFAARISAHAEAAAAATGVRLVCLERPAWEAVVGDDWREAPSMEAAARLIGEAPAHVFLAIGRQELSLFAAHPQHRYLIRSVEPPEVPQPLAAAQIVLARGPFREEDERALLQRERIEIVVAKNSGGAATYGKIAAARSLSLPVVMVRRPRPPARGAATSVDEALSVLVHGIALPQDRGE